MADKLGLLTSLPIAPKPAGNRLLAAFPSDCRNLLEHDLEEISLARGFFCLRTGDPIEHAFFPMNGMISLLVTNGGGAMVEVSSVGHEGAVGLQGAFGDRNSFAQAVVQIPGHFCVIPARRLEQAANQSPMLRSLILGYMAVTWAEAQQNAACNAIHDGSSRLCRWLLQCSDRIRSDQIPLTQEFLAEMLGLRRTTVTLLAQELQKKGLVRYTRGRIAILDRAGLQECACECYQTAKPENLSRLIGVKLYRG